MNDLRSLVMVLLLSGCGHILPLTDPVPGWPKLEVRERPGFFTTIANCSKYTNPLTWPPIGCVEFDLDKGTCDNYFWKIPFLWRWIRDEENKHCVGRDHFGETYLAEFLRAWQAMRGRPPIGSQAPAAGR